VTDDFCLACTASVLDAVESNRVMREMRAFSKQVNAAIVDPGFITDVRKKLDLDQREAAEIFGGGINAFSRYENSKTKPTLSEQIRPLHTASSRRIEGSPSCSGFGVTIGGEAARSIGAGYSAMAANSAAACRGRVMMTLFWKEIPIRAFRFLYR
jgi:hypothetical protein